MIPVFSHCQECGCPPVPMRMLWSDSDEIIGWWCRVCKMTLLVERE